MREGPPTSSHTEAAPSEAPPEPHFQAELLADFRQTCELEHQSGHHPEGKEKVELYDLLHKYLDDLEDAAYIKRYEQGTVPTIESLNISIELAREALRAIPDDPDAVRIERLLQGQHGVIRNWTKRYVNSVIAFHVKKKDWQLLSGTDQRDAFSAADVERRRVHNALLAALKTLNDLLVEATEYSDFVMPPRWSKQNELPAGSSHHKPLVFSHSAIADRDLIKSWAIAANSVEELKKLLETDDLPPE